MSTVKKSWSVQTTCVLVLLTLALGANMSAQESKKPLPRVASAGVPLYPASPRIAHIEGVVRLRVSTDGKRVSEVQIESGQPMLAAAAKENVKSWEFEKHDPTSFEATFRYKILPPACELSNPTVLLRLPSEVEVTATGWQTCDPATQAKPKEPQETVAPKTGNLHVQVPIVASSKTKQ
jgi:Gram-negative bacterial TonB protein C-terminal